MHTKLAQKLQFLLCLAGVLLWMLAGCLQMFVSAAALNGSLTMICKTTEGVVLQGMEWEIYRVGGRTDDGKGFELQGEYADYPISLEDMSASAMLEAAETLEVYAIQKTPLDSGVTNANGNLRFDGLDAGLYLVYGDYVQVGDTYYFFSSFLMEIPEEDGAVIDLTAYPKYISMNATGADSGHSVKKIWENDETEPENRSVYITAEIYRDGVLYDTVRLDESNNWTYEWTCEGVYKWHVLEKEIPAGYDVIYRSDETDFLIVNTFTDSSSIIETATSTDSNMTETQESTVTDITETAVSTETDVTEPSTDDTNATQVTTTKSSATTAATTVTTTVTTSSSTTEKLPQTGQLWWPVPLLGIMGLVFITIGVRLRTKE